MKFHPHDIRPGDLILCSDQHWNQGMFRPVQYLQDVCLVVQPEYVPASSDEGLNYIQHMIRQQGTDTILHITAVNGPRLTVFKSPPWFIEVVRRA